MQKIIYISFNQRVTCRLKTCKKTKIEYFNKELYLYILFILAPSRVNLSSILS